MSGHDLVALQLKKEGNHFMDTQIFGAFLRTQPREPGMTQALRKVHYCVKNMPDGS